MQAPARVPEEDPRGGSRWSEAPWCVGRLVDPVDGLVKWYIARRGGWNMPSNHTYVLDKQAFFESYPNRYVRNLSADGIESREPLPPELRSGTEAVTSSPSGDPMRVVSEQVFTDPDGKAVTPVRQFCKTQILLPGVHEDTTHQIDLGEFKDMDEAILEKLEITSTKMHPKQMDIKIIMPYSDPAEPPAGKLIMANKECAIRSVSDENRMVLNHTYNNDAAITDGQTKPAGGGPKDGHWVDGNTGAQITDDEDFTADKKLTVRGLKAAKEAIQNGGQDVHNLVTYIPVQAMRDVIDDLKPEIITKAAVKRIAGTSGGRSGYLWGRRRRRRP